MTGQARTIWTFAITSVALFMVVLDNLVVSTAIPVIRVDLGASIEQLEWTVNAYTLTFAVLLLTGAALGDRFGRRRVFLLGLALFTGRLRRPRWRRASRR
jgi:MFS family permease